MIASVTPGLRPCPEFPCQSKLKSHLNSGYIPTIEIHKQAHPLPWIQHRRVKCETSTANTSPAYIPTILLSFPLSWRRRGKWIVKSRLPPLSLSLSRRRKGEWRWAPFTSISDRNPSLNLAGGIHLTPAGELSAAPSPLPPTPFPQVPPSPSRHSGDRCLQASYGQLLDSGGETTEALPSNLHFCLRPSTAGDPSPSCTPIFHHSGFRTFWAVS